MKRRTFVKASILTGSLANAIPLLSHASDMNKPKKTNRQFYDLRVYTVKNETQQKMVEDYFEHAAIPALNKLGSKNIGVFTEQKPEGQTKIYTLIPFGSMEEYIDIPDRMMKDAAYQQAGAAYLNAPATDPAYERIESSLLHAFTNMPVLQAPENKPRMFELRRYESHSETAGRKKIEIFNEGGEMEIFKRVGLTPVFFGESLFGGMRPNLTYMLTFDDMDEHDRNWKVFGSDPAWIKLKSIPENADAKIVSRITRTFLVPASFSQV